MTHSQYLSNLASSPDAIQTRDPHVLNYLDKLYQKHPVARQHRRAFMMMGADFTYALYVSPAEAKRAGIPDHYIGSYLALVRLHPSMGERFNIFKEIPVI